MMGREMRMRIRPAVNYPIKLYNNDHNVVVSILKGLGGV